MTSSKSNIKIRHSNKEDWPAIYDIYLTAFDSSEAQDISDLVKSLLAEPSESLISLVAEHNQQIIGHVIFSAVSVDNNPSLQGHILAPLAVDPKNQKQGVGTLLVKHGLELITQQGSQFWVVYGDPNYYQRFGFESNHKIAAPYPLQYPEGWLAQSIDNINLIETELPIRCIAPLMKPKYW